jgi:hypothetical protein
MKKQSYNNSDYDLPLTHPYDVTKWTTAMRDLYSRMQNGLPKKQAFQIVTRSWDVNEIKNFSNWLKYYEERNHMKYKQAQQMYYVSDRDDSYFVPLDKMKPEVSSKMEDPSDANDAAKNLQVSEEERKRIIDLQRRKIIGRLQSARKLLTDEKGKLLGGEDWEKLLDAFNNLEKMFHTVNKKSIASTVFEDLIIREANRLGRDGYVESSKFLQKFAQAAPVVPAIDPAAIPGLPAVDPAAPPVTPVAAIPAPPAKPTGMEEFLKNLSGAGLTDENESDDSMDSDDGMDDAADDDNMVVEIEEEQGPLTVEAQMAPPAKLPVPAAKPIDAPPAKLPPPDAKSADLEVTDEPEEKGSPKASPAPSAMTDFDSLIDAAFANLKVADIVNKLEELSRIFKNREIARQLSVVDMMMDKLGLSSFFPSLAEATRSALESNQYCLTRIEDVKNKLSGAVDTQDHSLHDMGQEHSIRNKLDTKKLDEMPNIPPGDTHLEQVKHNLETDQRKEKLKKNLRKNLEDSALLESGNKAAPEVEGVENELSQPTAIPAAKRPEPVPAPLPVPKPAV